MRERIKAGKVRAEKVIDRGNAVYRVYLNSSPPSAESAPPPTAGDAPPVLETSPPLTAGLGELALVLREKDQQHDRLHRENLELAGRCGVLQAKLQDAEARIALLEAPKPAPAEAAAAETTNPRPQLRTGRIRALGAFQKTHGGRGGDAGPRGWRSWCDEEEE